MANVNKSLVSKKKTKRNQNSPMVRDAELMLSTGDKSRIKRRVKPIETTILKPTTSTFRSISQQPRTFSPIETPSGRSPHSFGTYRNQSPDVALRVDTPPLPVPIRAHKEGVLVLPNSVNVTPVQDQSPMEQSSIGDSDYGFYDTEFKGGKKRTQKRRKINKR